MIGSLLQPEVQQFILEHEQDDERTLVLQKREILGIPSSIIAEQIAGRRKAKTKLPLYYNTLNIVYPPGLNLEQSSSEKTAAFKANTLESILADKKILVDLTGGLGVDSYFMSRVFQRVIHVEPSSSLHEITQHNHKVLKAENIIYKNSTAEDFLKMQSGKVDCIFIDPSRRDKSNQKVIRLSDCEPDVPALLSEIFEKTNYLFIKTSPLLDVQQGIKELQHVKKVWVVSVDNECKELLFLCQKNYSGSPDIVAVNLAGSQQEEFSFTLEEEKNTQSEFSEPLNYLYEPNASVLKSGAFKLIGKNFSLQKLHPSTHLYTSNVLVQSFPGRIFKIIQSVKADPKTLHEVFPEGKANILTRNYPLSSDELKKKTKLKDGGARYLIGCSGQRQKYLLAAERIV